MNTKDIGVGIRKIVLAAMISVLAACGGERQSDQADSPQDLSADSASYDDTLRFAQDGETVSLNVDDEISVKLDLPSGITDASISWQPIGGWPNDIVEEKRTYRSLEGDVNYTDFILQAIKTGQQTLTFAPMQRGVPDHEERRTITFVVK